MKKKKNKVNFNGELFSSKKKIFNTSNRAFLYGDALFETIRMFDGELPFLDKHIKRLRNGLSFLKYKIPKNYNAKFFQKEIKKIAKGNARIRLTVFRNSGGLYTPQDLNPQFLITASPLTQSKFHLNKKGLNIGLFDDFQLPCSTFSNLKTTNSLPYIMAGIYKEEQNLSDCLLLNEKGRIAEASSSNIFLFKNNEIITPSLSEGCISGTLRQSLIDIAKVEKLKIHEIPVTLSALQQAEEVWLTNAIQGIRWVKSFDNQYFYTNTKAKALLSKLNFLTEQV